MYENLKKQILKIPHRSGVYFFKNSHNEILYVGKALDLKDRLGSYFQKDISIKTTKMLQLASKIDHIETGTNLLAIILEAYLIKKHQPKYNIALKDGKSYLYLFISTGEEFPIIIPARKPLNIVKDKKYYHYLNLKGDFFGPFTSSQTVYNLLKLLRKIFPFCQQVTHKKICFYHHLKLCNPCPAAILKTQGNEYLNLKKNYRRNIRYIINVLEGHIDAIRQDLLQQIRILSENLQFEHAGKIRDQLYQLEYLEKSHDISGFLEQNNFYQQQQERRTKSLLQELNQYFPNIKTLNKIECFDVSHLGGNHVVASNVVFINGSPDKSLYKRYQFKINVNNDPYYIKQTLLRRLKHINWPYPDLIIVDGGKIQLRSGLQALSNFKITIPIIGLAKKLEQLIIFKENKFLVLNLPKNNLGLLLLKQIRDESHRFALAYQKIKRKIF